MIWIVSYYFNGADYAVNYIYEASAEFEKEILAEAIERWLKEIDQKK